MPTGKKTRKGKIRRDEAMKIKQLIFRQYCACTIISELIGISVIGLSK